MRRLLLGVLLGVLSVLAFVGCSAAPVGPNVPGPASAVAVMTTTAVPTFTLNGTFDQITATDGPLMADQSPCRGFGDYADLQTGSPVYVFDEAGHLLATGSVEVGTYGYIDHASSCGHDLLVQGVPDGLPTYGVEVAQHGVHQVGSFEAHNRVLLTVGP